MGDERIRGFGLRVPKSHVGNSARCMHHHNAGVSEAGKLGHHLHDVLASSDLDDCWHHVVVVLGDDHRGLWLVPGARWPADGPFGGGGGLCLLVGAEAGGWRLEVETEVSKTWREVHWHAMLQCHCLVMF